ncbi:hypothetical protein A2872_01060 [Candidatus Gottesmanbacteria bacterium RIFCSPHIGHO2_01_FULL_42_12]|uniref:DUF5667 domain-containing protein n=1 Tax=Candidatus Gottesmanbacteria bacterium RIFCSPHIGHO2_01_FULL_42_12 TaxID=1798377 RepID=A0A1F5Z3W6_9BACT|nr:MAG: hypothetical protein A2872_01060 [Candidatus Gottesmanbacteria bacterium RIFCSPHIGHO2_01_FULL_42_12]
MIRKVGKIISLIILLFVLSFAVSSPVSAEISTNSAKYDLPYPGILPDSPLWPIKDLRDKLIGLVVFDPVIKGQYELRLADKKLAMAQVLINTGKGELGEKVLIWASDGYDRAIDRAEESKLKKLNYETLASRLSLFAAKYAEVSGLSKPTERIRKLFIENITNP